MRGLAQAQAQSVDRLRLWLWSRSVRLASWSWSCSVACSPSLSLSANTAMRAIMRWFVLHALRRGTVHRTRRYTGWHWTNSGQTEANGHRIGLASDGFTHALWISLFELSTLILSSRFSAFCSRFCLVGLVTHATRILHLHLLPHLQQLQLQPQHLHLPPASATLLSIKFTQRIKNIPKWFVLHSPNAALISPRVRWFWPPFG